MHARNRTWALGSDPVERCRQRTLPVEGGDGSTLSLDFTTGILDPRLTFSRTTNATFINSQGYVEWANSNMYWNTAFEGLSGTNPSLTSSGWGYALSTAGSAVFNGDGTMTVTTTASDRRAIFRSSGFTGKGLRVVAAVDVFIHSGSLTASQVIVTGTPTNAQHYVNGVIWNSSHPIWNSGVLPVGTAFNIAYATDSLTGSTTSIYFGVGCTSATAGSATFSNPCWTMWKGSGTVPYYPNTSATNNSTTDRYKSNDYQAPRFDHDPTTLAPRGLLIEGSANNLATYSNLQAAWSGGTNTTLTANTTDVLSPDGTNNAAKVALTNAGYCSRFESITGLAASTAYTFSYWIRGTAGNQQRIYSATAGADLVTQTTLSYSTTGWTRVQINFTTTAAISNVYIYVVSRTNGTASDVVYIWGAQLETGTGPSSLIPTGASTGSRAADSCVMTGTNFSSWFAGATEGVFFSEYEAPRSLGSADYFCLGTQYAAGTFIGLSLNNANRYPQASISPGGGFRISGSITTTATTPMKHAAKWSGVNNVLVIANGVVGSAHAATTGTPSLTMFSIGSSSTSGTAATGDYLNACVRRVKFWPTALPNATIQAITT